MSFFLVAKYRIMHGYGFAEIVNRIIKYLIEGLVIAAAAIFIPKRALPLDGRRRAVPQHAILAEEHVVPHRRLGRDQRLLIGAQIVERARRAQHVAHAMRQDEPADRL